MALSIGNKTFMNLQEAVGWLLENNALPFQSTANYAGNTEIAMSTLINPSPAKVRVGSIIFFADSKVSTVIGVTSNSFICSDQYNDLVDDVVYVSNVALNASGHLIVTLSNGDTIDAGLIKQVSNFSINGSQHLIASYNDGTSTDLGAIFSGNITISGNLTVTGGISGNAITGNSIIENMSGYSATFNAPSGWTMEKIYIGIVKTGNKITLVIAFNATKGAGSAYNPVICDVIIPLEVAQKLYPTNIGGINFLDNKVLNIFSAYDTYVSTPVYLQKYASTTLRFTMASTALVQDTKYYVRYEATFLLSDSL